MFTVRKIAITFLCVDLSCAIIAMNSSTMGNYFIVQMVTLYNKGRCTASAFTVSLKEVAVTFSTRTKTETRKETRGASQHHPATFKIGPNFGCSMLGICATLVFKGNGYFALDLLIFLADDNVDALQAIPVAGFGTKYIVMTMGGDGYLLMISSTDSTQVTVNIKMDKGLNVLIAGANRATGDFFLIEIDKEESFNINLCGLGKFGDLTGTTLQGNQFFGLITGTCNYVIPSDKKCNVTREDGNYLADMALPAETYGCHFIIWEAIDSRRYGMVVTSETDTTIKVHEARERYSVVVPRAGVLYSLSHFPSDSYVITTNKPCSCYMVFPSTCDKTEFGDGTVTVVAPNELFYNLYMWSFQTDDYTVEKLTLVIFVVHVSNVNSIQLNSTLFKDKHDISWKTVIGTNEWRVGNLILIEGTHYTVVTSGGHRFGCYVMVFSRGFGFVSNLGFLLSSINTKYRPCSISNSSSSIDYIDNDCDGQIDEEMLNNVDDDVDGSVDEDIGDSNLSTIRWTEWCQWTCKEDCGVSTYIKHRYCTFPFGSYEEIVCPGLSSESKPGVCNTGLVCFEDICPIGTYGDLCSRDCSRCESKCQRNNGSCSSCKPGWMNPGFSCNTECPEWTYGPQCDSSCQKKCGEDCVERAQGLCPESLLIFDVMVYIVFPILSVMMLILVIIVFWNRTSITNALISRVTSIHSQSSNTNSQSNFRTNTQTDDATETQTNTTTVQSAVSFSNTQTETSVS